MSVRNRVIVSERARGTEKEREEPSNGEGEREGVSNSERTRGTM